MNREVDSIVIAGITGGIACGKSTVGKFLQDHGVAVMEADQVAHATLMPGGEAYSAVVEYFGEDILDRDRQINRRKLGEVVFADNAEREKLNSIVHPHVRRIWRAWINERRSQKENAAVVIPLLFEVGETKVWDSIVCVAAPRCDVMQRLESRGLTKEEARRRMEAQMPLAEKMRRADHVIMNDGTLEDLEKKTQMMWKEIERQGDGQDDG